MLKILSCVNFICWLLQIERKWRPQNQFDVLLFYAFSFAQIFYTFLPSVMLVGVRSFRTFCCFKIFFFISRSYNVLGLKLLPADLLITISFPKILFMWLPIVNHFNGWLRCSLLNSIYY